MIAINEYIYHFKVFWEENLIPYIISLLGLPIKSPTNYKNLHLSPKLKKGQYEV